MEFNTTLKKLLHKSTTECDYVTNFNILFMGHIQVPCALILIQRIQKETNLIGQYILTILTAELSMTTCSMS